MFATGGMDTKLKIYDGRTGDLRATLLGCLQGIMDVNFSTADDLILAAANDNATRLWSISTGRLRVNPSPVHWELN